jgi:hypothetical protein
MSTKIRFRRPAPLVASYGGLVVWLLMACAAAPALAVPLHTPTVDGVITGNGTDWDAADRVVDDIADDSISTRQANLRRVWLTWDADRLYLGVTYQDFGTEVATGALDALTVYLDLDADVGPTNAALLDSLPSSVALPAGHHIDFIIGRTAADGFSGGKPRAFRVTDAAGTVLAVSNSVTAAQGYNTGTVAEEKALFPFWLNGEIAIPWSVLYPELGGSVPPRAVVKAVAFIGRDNATRNGIDPAPNNAGFDGGSGAVTVTAMHASVIDANGDGTPDPANATISGLATLPLDDGTARLTVTAELIEFAGREPGAPLSAVTTAAGVRTWTLPRLPEGRYRVTTTALGYFADTRIVDVAAGQAVTGIDQTLVKATAIRGAVSFASGPGGAGAVELRGLGGAVLGTHTFTAAGGPFVFYVETGGAYVLAATAATYLPLELPIDVTTGVDYAGADLALIRQTRIAGHVGFAELVGGLGKPGTIYFRSGDGAALGLGGFAATGGDYEFFTPVGGTFNLRTETLPPVYVEVDTTFAVTAGQDVTALDFALALKARVRGAIALDGPNAPGTARLWDSRGVKRDSLLFDAAGDTFAFFLEPGAFRLELAATGYVPRSVPFVVSPEDTSLGALPLAAVRATHLVIVDEAGAELPEVRGTVYLPGQFTSARVLLAARDDAARADLYDVDGRLSDFRLSARKMDDLSLPRGAPVFYHGESEAAIDSVVGFTNGRAQFWMSNTAVEVLRVYLAQPGKAPLAGRIVVAFLGPQPVSVVLTSTRDALVAGGADTLRIEAQLYDSANQRARVPDVPVSFALAVGSGQFETATVLTNGDGRATAVLSSTVAGPVHVTASVVVQGRDLVVYGLRLDSDDDFLPVTVAAGATVGWRLTLPAPVSDLRSPVAVTALPIDSWGNATGESDLAVAFAADPASRGVFEPATAVTDTNGRAIASFLPSGLAGLVTLSATGAGLASAEAGLVLRNVAVIPDAAYTDEPGTRQTFDTTDLTALIVDNDPNALLLEIPFASTWSGLQLHVLFETNFDAAGATADPFVQPVNYAHAQKPDYALTTKWSANDYGDFRRWNPTASRWEWWSLDASDYSTADGGPYNIQGPWVRKLADRVLIRVPWAPFGGRPDSLKLELYLTQEEGGVKRAAFDSAPQDSTLNLTFDYNNPQAGDWDTTKVPTTLQAWGPTYVPKTDFPTPPTLSGATATPAEPTAGELLVVTVQVAEAGDGIGDVLADLSAMGGGTTVRLFDDGQSGHGDTAAGDGRYSATALVPIGNPGGEQGLILRAWDAGNAMASADTVTIDVTAIVEPIIQISDPVGDDHGPNQPGTQRKFITYPTNIAFVPGAFDLTGLTVFESVAVVGGVTVPMIAFQVSLAEFTDPTEPGAANWNPLYAKLNIEKIDILIDSGPGGATASLPNRFAAFQPWDAWDYAIIMDGWYKALIPSRSQNTVDSWRANALSTDQDILLIGDTDANTVTALVSKAALGDPTPEMIRAWDIAVCVASHDFGGEEVLGGIRWVNEGRSEWNFGGGRNSENGTDRDSNLIDLLLVPGTGHGAGLTQEEILDYESPAALLRQTDLLTPVAVEMSRFEDTGPPVIDTGGRGSVVTTVAPLLEAPLSLAFRLTDDDRVTSAEFRYRATNFAGQGWDRVVPMGYLGNSIWVVDVLPSFIDSLIASPIDTTRYIEFEIEADDPDTENEPTVSPVTTLQIVPTSSCRAQQKALTGDNIQLLQVDGSQLKLSERLRAGLVARHLEQVWSGDSASADTMGSRIGLTWDICTAPAGVAAVPTVPTGRPLGIFRTVVLATTDTLGGRLAYEDELPGTMELSLHYPQAWLPEGADEQLIALYNYNQTTGRWVLVGGNVNATGNNVTAVIMRAGTYGLFLTNAVAAGGDVLSGITISPNPFSPNGDGLYDETNISFYLSGEATVTVEIYDITGVRRALLTETFPYAGNDLNDPTPRRVPGLIWDGRSSSGGFVPYGVYILRVIATYSQAGNTRTIRSNHSVAVIR